MSPAATSRMPASERRALVVAAATREFASRGFHEASMAAIASAAGVSKPVVYDHFPSKAALHLHLLERERDRLLAATTSATSPAQSIEAFFTYVEEHPLAWRMLFRETTGDPRVAGEHERILAEARVGLARQIALGAGLSGGEPPSERHLELLAEGAMSVTHGLALWWLRHPGVPRAEVARAAVDLLVPGIERLSAQGRGQ